MLHRAYCIALLLSGLSIMSDGASAQSANDAAVFHARVEALYAFEPHLLSSEQQEAKSGDLDKFWSDVKGDPDTSLPLLRKELKNPKSSPYFAYDGSKLLLSLSTARDDATLALTNIARANLRDIQHTDYLRTVHTFAVNGFDVTQAALRILDYPDFRAIVPEHALTLAQDYALICMLAPMPESQYLAPLTKRLGSETSIVSQQSILMALWYSVTPDGKAAVAHFAEDAAMPSESRAYARQLLDRKAPPSFAALPTPVAQLRDDRRKAMSRISDEALEEFDRLTAEILAKQ